MAKYFVLYSIRDKCVGICISYCKRKMLHTELKKRLAISFRKVPTPFEIGDASVMANDLYSTKLRKKTKV